MGATLRESYLEHRSWLSVICAIKKLNTISFEMRAHRGITTSCLSGDELFYLLIDKNSKRIDQYMDDLKTWQSLFCFLGVEIDIQCLVHNWLQLKRIWQTKSPMENFNQHSEMLNDINVIIWRLAVSADYNLIENSDDNKARLCLFLLSAHRTVMESIARLRGIGSFLCAKDEVNKDESEMFRQEVKLIFIKWHEWIDAYQKLPVHYQSLFNHRVQHGQMTRDFIKFMSIVEPLQLEGGDIPNSSEVFNAANRLLSALQNQFNEGLHMMAECMPRELHSWVNGE